MVKLIRLKGDAVQNNKEIRNIFSDSITIKPKSKLALRSCRVRLKADPNQEVYEIGQLANGDSAATYDYNISNLTPLSVSVPVGTYKGSHALLRAMQVAANSVGVTGVATNIQNYQGIHNLWQVTNGQQATLSVYQATLANAGYTTQPWQNVGLGDPPVEGTTSSLTTTVLKSTGDLELLLRSSSIVPLVGARFDFTIAAPGSADVGNFRVGCMNHGSTDFAFNLVVDGTAGVFRLEQDGEVPEEVAEVPQPGDTVTLLKRGSRVILRVNNSRKALINLTQANLAFQNLHWGVKMETKAGATAPDRVFGIEASQCTQITNIVPPSQFAELGATSPVDVNLTFTNVDKNPLPQYLGLDDVNFQFQGNPATLTGKRMLGKISYPGCLLTIMGLDLDTYSGSAGAQKSGYSIIDVLYPEDEENPNHIQMRVNDAMKLNIKNEADMLIRDLTVAFVDASTSQPFEFTDDPIVVLEIYDPDEL